MFVFLPPVLKQKIAQFCHADDGLLSVSLTCKEVHRDLSMSVLSTPYEIVFSMLYVEVAAPHQVIKEVAMIPVFFEKHCHSVRVSWNFVRHRSNNNDQTRPSTWMFYVVAKPKQQSPSDITKITPVGVRPTHALLNELGEEGSIVWESQPHTSNGVIPFDIFSYDATMDATFRCEANQRYFLWCQCNGGRTGHSLLLQNFQLDRLLVWDDSQRIRKQIYDKCMALVQNLRDVISAVDPIDVSPLWDRSFHCSPGHYFPASFFAKLFALALETIDLEQNNTNHPIKTFFESNECGMTWTELDTALLLSMKFLATVYLQLIEEEEHFVGREPTTPTVTGDECTTPHLATLPPITLKHNFGWGVIDYGSTRVNNNDTIEEAKEPQFVSRIPVPSGTKSFRLTAEGITTLSPPRAPVKLTSFPRVTFLLYAKMPKDYHPESSDPSIAWDSSSIRPDLHLVWYGQSNSDGLDVVIDVAPAAKAYFLYVLPGNVGPKTFECLQVHLTVFEDDNESKMKVFDSLLSLLGLEEPQEDTDIFHLGLLRAVAEILIQFKGSDASSWSPRTVQSLVALAGLLEAEGFSLDVQDVLECLTQLIDEILQHRSPPTSSAGDEDFTAREMRFRNYAAM